MFTQNKDDKYDINNHLSFKVMYHLDPETDDARIVGFEVIPSRCLSVYTSFYSYNKVLAVLQCKRCSTSLFDAILFHRCATSTLESWKLLKMAVLLDAQFISLYY